MVVHLPQPANQRMNLVPTVQQLVQEIFYFARITMSTTHAPTCALKYRRFVQTLIVQNPLAVMEDSLAQKMICTPSRNALT